MLIIHTMERVGLTPANPLYLCVTCGALVRNAEIKPRQRRKFGHVTHRGKMGHPVIPGRR